MEVTGYGDEEVEESLNESSSNDEDAMIEKAKAKLTQEGVEAVVYGYISRGKFHSLQNDEIMEISNDRELHFATELVKSKYHPTGSVRVLYKNDLTESEDFKNRKDLSEAVLKCEKDNIKYTIKKSLKEGYRYTLVKEQNTVNEAISKDQFLKDNAEKSREEKE